MDEGAGSIPTEYAERQRLLRWRLLDVRERTLNLQGKRDAQRVDIDALQQLADGLDDDHRRAEVALRHSQIAMNTADYRAQEGAARQAMALAERAGDETLRLRAANFIASALFGLGDAAAAKALAQNGLGTARSRGLRRLESALLKTLALIAETQEDWVLLLELAQQVLPIDREIGDRRMEATAISNLGVAWLALGEHLQARYHLEEGYRLTRAVGGRTKEPYLLASLSMLALRQRDHELALTHAQAALDIAVAVQDPFIEAIALARLGDAELALGRFAAAASAFERERTVALTPGLPFLYDTVAGLARVALAQDDVAGAMSALEGLLAHLANGGTLANTEAPYLILLTCYQALARAADPRAAELLASAHARLQTRAATITDAKLRLGFLNNIPEHREIVAAWTAHEATSSGPQ